MNATYHLAKRLLPLLLAALVAVTALSAAPARAMTFTGPEQAAGLSGLSLSSRNALLIRQDNGEVLLSIGGEARIYPASMTKVMTALLAIETLPDLSALVTLRPGIYDGIYAANASTAGFLPGEQVAAVDLLHGVLLSSGAECSMGLAEHIAGSEAAYVERMNARAAELGMGNTHFVNVSGLHHQDHYSTPRDMALLLRYALQNETFRRIFTTREHIAGSTNLHENGLILPSTIFSRIDSADFPGGTLLGGKTGFTAAAGQCLASLAEKDGVSYILITAGAHPENYRTQILHIDDAFAVYRAI